MPRRHTNRGPETLPALWPLDERGCAVSAVYQRLPREPPYEELP